ncbi:MAG TPA: choice-of-anchor tandem repeat GloVer-containing protein [Rhizomicrobium sp.]|jgi:uncharacterized repeat protein (TIGR03803 family)|nr:choice-of-anchor tandem repeat GloVer-containing protein [Rhizomicrobium sp.]
MSKLANYRARRRAGVVLPLAAVAALAAGGLSTALAKGASYEVLYNFAAPPYDGALPVAGVIDVNGTLYGTTEVGGIYAGDGSGGTMFSVDPTTGAETLLHSFGSGLDGNYPGASVIDVKGTLYGTTVAGGANGYTGTVFSVDPTTGVETVLHSFPSSATDGIYPVASLIDVNGTLYGTTERGGAYGDGMVFSVDPKTTPETVLHSFGSGTDGEYSFAGLIDVGGTLYGTTEKGGTYGDGTVFSVNPTTGAETVVYSFCSQRNCTDGESPVASLIDVNGALYGTTGGGGTGDGTVFSVNLTTGAETVLYSFGSTTYPYASLIDVKGMLYGATEVGGTSTSCGFGFGCGAVFSVDPTTGAEKVVYSFCGQQNCTDGEHPRASLIDVKGTLYGITEGGGANDDGTVFALMKP